MAPTPEELEMSISAELARVGVRARPVVFPTPWDAGPVIAYLFPDDPVTFVDSGVDSAGGREALRRALAAERLLPSDTKRVIVTHGHSDHIGGAAWLQDESGCEVFLHQADIDLLAIADRRASLHDLFLPLGFSEAELDDRLRATRSPRPVPELTALGDGRLFGGDTPLFIEHHPGHMPGHVWVVETGTQAMFVGDYLLAASPTNPGLALDRRIECGRAPLLESYTAGLRELGSRRTPAIFPAHGLPITDHVPLIERRLRKSQRRTNHVLEGLARYGPGSALVIGMHLYGDRVRQNWGALADVVGRLDLLVATGHARTRMGEDGVWLFEATPKREESDA